MTQPTTPSHTPSHYHHHNYPSQFLNLGGNLLSGTIPPSLSSLTELQQVVLSDNALRGGLPAQLSNATSLALLDVANNVLNGSLPLQWCDSKYDDGWPWGLMMTCCVSNAIPNQQRLFA